MEANTDMFAQGEAKQTAAEKAAYDQYWAAQTREKERAAMQNPEGIGAITLRRTLRDRLKEQIDAAGQAEIRARKANELYDLLNQHPEVARILELIEEVG